MDYKLMQHAKSGRLYYATSNGASELIATEGAIELGDRVYIVEEDTMYYGGNDGLLYKEGDGTEFVPSNG